MADYGNDPNQSRAVREMTTKINRLTSLKTQQEKVLKNYSATSNGLSNG